MYQQQEGTGSKSAAADEHERSCAWKTATVSPAEEVVPLDRQPIFTDQDNARDLASLTFQDLVTLQEDLLGMSLNPTAAAAGLAAAAGAAGANASARTITTTASSVAADDTRNVDADDVNDVGLGSSLRLLEDEISRLPPDRTAAYRRAKEMCPFELTRDRKRAFIERENGNIAQAARRMARYWQMRLDLFGEDRCYHPMTLAGAMADEAAPAMEMKIHQVLPVTDTAGRKIIYTDMSLRNYGRYSMDQEIRWFFFLVEALSDSDNGRKNGYVMLINAKNIQLQHASRKFHQFVCALDLATPGQLRAVHVCQASSAVAHFVYPWVKYALPKHIRLRFILHPGSMTDVTRELEGYSLPRGSLPLELGGRAKLDMSQWMLERLALENDRLSARISEASGGSSMVQSPGTLLETNGTPAAKRLRIEDSATVRNGTISSEPSAARSNNAAENEQIDPDEDNANSKPTKGRKIDPRMIRAVKAKQDKPSMSIQKALEVGGFVFHQSPRGLIDADGISLKQR